MCLEAALYEGRVNVKTYQGGIADPEFYEGQNSKATGRRVRNRTRKSDTKIGADHGPRDTPRF